MLSRSKFIEWHLTCTLLKCKAAGRLVALSLHVSSHAPALPPASAPDPLFLKILKPSSPLTRNPDKEDKGSLKGNKLNVIIWAIVQLDGGSLRMGHVLDNPLIPLLVLHPESPSAGLFHSGVPVWRGTSKINKGPVWESETGGCVTQIMIKTHQKSKTTSENMFLI